VTTPIDDAKNEIRKVVQARRNSLQTGATDTRASAVAIHGMELVRKFCQPGDFIGAFASLGFEPPTDLLISTLSEYGYKVLLPNSHEDKTITWYRYDGEWGVDELGIAAPLNQEVGSLNDCALLFIPALAASNDGSRLGRGAGYYDRALSQVPAHKDGGPLRVAVIDMAGLLPDGQIPMADFDQYVDAVLVG
jgi:5-formyltetrahydrofolate cyclo-ligase